MRPIGYLYKRVLSRPVWLRAGDVSDVYSLSGCVSENFADYVPYWKHNGYWLFDSPRVIEDLAAEHSIELEGLKLFYYEAHEKEYDEEQQLWGGNEPEASFQTEIVEPVLKTLEGFDVTTFSQGGMPECSPLSCNSGAVTLHTNAHCLFQTFDEAVRAIEEGAFKDSEPGPFRVIAVYSVETR